MDYFDHRLTNLTWSQLTVAEQSQSVLLGWDPEGRRWNEMSLPDTYASPWNELLPSQREAAAFLGYNMSVWNGCTQPVVRGGAPCLERLKRFENRTGSWDWLTMPLGIQRDLQELGWTQRSWIEAERPPVYRLAWQDLDLPSFTSARLIGLSRDTWAACPDATCTDRLAYLRWRWASTRWSEMQRAEQRAWSLLGTSDEAWAGPSYSNIFADSVLRWDELSTEQMEAAEFLGHSAGTWQGCNNATWGAPANETEEVVDPNRTVRAHMTILRPFSEVSGNVYGAAVASLPTSFIQVFETSIARVLFCDNPATSDNPAVYMDADGQPTCNDVGAFERQRGRVQVVTVEEGSIIVDFLICGSDSGVRELCGSWNATGNDRSPVHLFAYLERQLADSTTSLTQDVDFGRFAQYASVQEANLTTMEDQALAAALDFENLRNRYGRNNACELREDTRNGIVWCANAATRRSPPPGRSVWWRLWALGLGLLLCWQA